MRRQDVWDKQDLYWLPGRCIYSVWMAVYISQVVWVVIYVPWMACRGRTTKVLTSCVPVGSFLTFMLGLVSLLCWMLLWDYLDMMHYSALCLLASTCLFGLTFAQCMVAFLHHECVLAVKAVVDYWCIKLLIHNAVAAITTWCLLLLLHQVSMIIADQTTLSCVSIQYIFIACVVAYTLLWFGSSITAPFMTFVVTPYILVILVFVVMILFRHKGTTADDVTLIVTCVILGIVSVMLLVTMAVSFGHAAQQLHHAGYKESWSILRSSIANTHGNTSGFSHKLYGHIAFDF